MVAGALAIGSVIAPSFAFAQSAGTSTEQTSVIAGAQGNKTFTKKDMLARASRGVSGTVTAISGSVITINNSKKTATYTIDTTGATFDGGMTGNSLTLSNILVGDKINVKGTVTGTNISASSISDLSYIARTVFSGKVTAVSGSTITLVKNKNVTYTVDVGSATFKKGFGKNAKTISASDVSVGDRLTVVGTLTGNDIAATQIKDNTVPAFGSQAVKKVN